MIASLIQLAALKINANDNGVNKLETSDFLANALDLAYLVAGIVAVVIIIISGLRYTASAGDPGAVTKAKNMLTYAIAGLIVVIFAFIITRFVIGAF